MSWLFQRTSVASALALFLGFGALHCAAAPIDISGGSSATVGGWQISPGAGISLSGVSYNSSTLAVDIQSESATFTSGTPIPITFTQVSDQFASSVVIGTASIQNSTSSNWTGFVFSLSTSAGPSAAGFEGVGLIFLPPLSYGATTTVNLTNDNTVLTYQGTQAAGTTSSWGGTTASDSLLIDTPLALGANFTLDEAPQGVSSVTQAVPTPTAASMSLVGLGLVMLYATTRKAIQTRKTIPAKA